MAEGRVLVSCYSGRTYADRPVSLIWEGIERKIVEVEKEWLEPGARLFKVHTEDGRFFVLSYNERGDEWAAFEVTGRS